MSVATFREAAESFAELVHRIPPGAWAGPGLGEWDLRALVGHTSRSLITVETYLTQPADQIACPGPAAYYAMIAGADPQAVAERGRAAGQALGADPAGVVDALVARVPRLVDRDDDPVITTAAGGMRLSDYLPTRTVELVVHGQDIAAAASLAPPAVRAGLQAEVLTLMAEVAVLRGRGLELLRAVTGRSTLAAGFSLV